MSDYEVWVDAPDDFSPQSAYEWEPLEVHPPGVLLAVRKQVAEEIAQAIETFQAESADAPMAVQLAIGSGHNYLVRAVEIAREIGSKEHSNQATEETK